MALIEIGQGFWQEIYNNLNFNFTELFGKVNTEPETLAWSPTIEIDASTGLKKIVVAGGNTDLSFVNFTNGQSVDVYIQQDATGNRLFEAPVNSIIWGGGNINNFIKPTALKHSKISVESINGVFWIIGFQNYIP